MQRKEVTATFGIQRLERGLAYIERTPEDEEPQDLPTLAVRVLDAYSVKPLDAEGVRAAAAACEGRVLVVEDHFPEGGLGDAVGEVLAETGGARLRKLAVRELPHSGRPEELLDRYGLSGEKIAQAVRDFVG